MRDPSLESRQDARGVRARLMQMLRAATRRRDAKPEDRGEQDDSAGR